MIAARPASRQALGGRGSRCGGLRHAATSLRCSAWGGAAELATLRSAQTTAASQTTKRAARAHPKPARIKAPQFAPAAQRLPGSGRTLEPMSVRSLRPASGDALITHIQSNKPVLGFVRQTTLL